MNSRLVKVDTGKITELVTDAGLHVAEEKMAIVDMPPDHIRLAYKIIEHKELQNAYSQLPIVLDYSFVCILVLVCKFVESDVTNF